MRSIRSSQLVLWAACGLAFLSGCGGDDGPGTSTDASQTLTLNGSGVTSAEASVSLDSATLTVASGTRLTDSGQAALAGTSASLSLRHADHERFLPDAAAQLPRNRRLLAFVELSASAGTQKATAFSPAAGLSIKLAGVDVVAGEAVSLFRFDGGAWSTAADGSAIVGNDTRVGFGARQVSLWAAMKPSSALFSSKAFLGDVAKLTQSYIPPLLYTNLPAVNTTQAVCTDAQKALTRLVTVWADFKTRYRNTPEFSAHAAKFNEIDANIAQAGSIIQAATTAGQPANDLLEAHEALEVIRHHMLEMDRTNGFDYAIDVIKDFHDAMEPFALAVKGKTGATLTDTDIATLKSMFPAVESTWNQVVAYQINREHFGLSADVKAFVDAATANQSLNLQALKAALMATNLGASEKTVVATNGNKIKPLFLNLFFSFADFITPFDADLVAADQAAAAAVTATSKNQASADDAAAALVATAALETAFNRFKAHFATQPMSIMGVLTWATGSASAPGYFDKIGAAIAAAKTQIAGVQTAASYPADLAPARVQLQVYATEMAKLRLRMSHP